MSQNQPSGEWPDDDDRTERLDQLARQIATLQEEHDARQAAAHQAERDQERREYDDRMELLDELARMSVTLGIIADGLRKIAESGKL